MKKSYYVVMVVLLILAGGGSFFAGMKYQQKKQPTRANFQARMGIGQDISGTGQRLGAGVVRGEIISQDAESITVKLPDGSSKIVLISGNTQISKATEGLVDDLKAGEQVMVFGQTNSDGSISASQIQLNFN